MQTITLPDGYNEHTVQCLTKPIDQDGDLVKLRVAGSTYLFTWTHRDKWKKLVRKTEVSRNDKN